MTPSKSKYTAWDGVKEGAAAFPFYAGIGAMIGAALGALGGPIGVAAGFASGLAVGSIAGAQQGASAIIDNIKYARENRDRPQA